MSDDSDDGGSRRTRIVPEVMELVEGLQHRLIKSKQKKHITAFARWYFSKKPNLPESDLAYLLLGQPDAGRRGLLESCGNSNLKKIGDIKKSSVLALELVVMLLDATINIHSYRFLEYLPRVPIKVLQSMKLDRHILSESEEPEHAFKLLFMLHEQRPGTPISAYLDGSHAAVKAYEEWYADHIADDEEDDDDADDGPTTWSQVVLEDVDREEAAGMEADIESIMLDTDGGSGTAEDESETMMDPLGLTRMQLNARGGNGIGIVGASAKNRQGVSSSKRMKQFWKKLLKQKEVALAKHELAAHNSDGRTSVSPKASSLEEDEDDGEDAVGVHLLDAIMEKGSMNPRMPDFNPVLFLTSVHSSTPLASLERGLTYLEQSLSDRTLQMSRLVEQHFGQYVYCKDTLDHLHQLLQSEIKVASSSGRSVRLIKDIESVRRECEQLYAPLLQRKTETDQIRSVLSILERFKFLFSLPRKLREKKGGWEQVIRDYQKAKLLVVIKQSSSKQEQGANNAGSTANSTTVAAGANNAGPVATPANSVSLLSLLSSSGAATASTALAAGDLGIPESILLEIASLVRSLRAELFRLLDNPVATWAEQEKVIGYLLALDCETDPAWYYLTKQREAISGRMEQAMREMAQRIEAAVPSAGLPQNCNGACEPNDPLRLVSASVPLSQLVLSTGETVSALDHFVRRLCHIVSKSLPEFLQLAQHIDTGKWSHNASAAQAAATETHASEKANGNNAVSGGVCIGPSAATIAAAVESHSVGRLIGLINSQFVSYIRLALFPQTRTSKPAGSPSSAAAASAAAANGTAAASAAVPTPGATPASLSSAFPDRPLFSFPPSMFSHVHSILSCVDSIRSLPHLPLEYTADLRLLSDQLVSFYLDHHVRELLTNVAALHKEETWEIDAGRLVGDDTDELESLLIDEDEDDAIASSLMSVESSSGGLPLGHGHAGTGATNAAFQVTTMPSQFHYLLRSTLVAFSAVPLIQSRWIVERMVGATFEAIKVFADGLHALAMQIRAAQDAQGHATNYDRHAFASGAMPSGAASFNGGVTSAVVGWVKPSELDRRLLLIWSNLIYTTDHLLSPLFDQLLHLLPLSTHAAIEAKFNEDVLALCHDVLEQRILLPTYVKSKVASVNHIVKKGYFKNGINWRSKKSAVSPSGASSPTASSARSSSPSSTLVPRSCVLELLLQFVLIHDELYSTRKEEVDRVMEMIVEQVAHTLVSTVKYIDSLCDLAGANQFLFELELISSTLDYYLDDESAQMFDDAKSILTDRIETEAELESIGRSTPSQLVDAAASERATLATQWKATTDRMFIAFTSVRMRRRKEAAAAAGAATTATNPTRSKRSL